MITAILAIVCPILIAASGGLVCERSGVTNVALEGLMSFGAMSAAAACVLLQSAADNPVPAALIFAAAAGGIFSLILAFAAVTLNADQIVCGTGINLLSNGITIFACQILFRMDRTPHYGLAVSAGLSVVCAAALTAIVIFAAVWFVLRKRPFGLRLRAAGENPQALARAGINVKRIRYAAVLISGILAGLAGGFAVLAQGAQFTANTINGKGFIALAAVCFGARMPLGILAASLLFGVTAAPAAGFAGAKALQSLPSEMFNMLPFLTTLLALVVLGKRKKSALSGTGSALKRVIPA